MKLCAEIDQEYPAIKIIEDTDNIPSGYEDLSSAVKWHEYLEHLSYKYDYKFVRNEIKKLYISIGWETLSVPEKIVCVKYLIATPIERNEYLTIEQQVELGRLFHKNAIGARILRMSKVSCEIYNRLDTANVNIVLNDINNTDQLYFNYIYFGHEGTLEGDPEGIFDYLESRVGTSYEGNGFSTRSYPVVGFDDMNAFSIYLLNIFYTGL